MVNNVYIISYCNQVSSLGFNNIDDAFDWINSRHGIEKFTNIGWKWEHQGETYKIHEVNIQS